MVNARNTIPELTAQLAERLKAFLESPRRPQGTMDYFTLSGFLFAVAGAPDIVVPSEWLPLAFNERDIGFTDANEAGEIMPILLSLDNSVIHDGDRADDPSLPPLCDIQSPATDNLDESAPLSRWSHGFVMGYDYMSEVWDESLPKDENLENDLGGSMMVMSFFTGRKLAEKFVRLSKRRDIDLETMAEEMTKLLPMAMSSYARLGWAIRRVTEEHSPATHEANARASGGRNGPCPCGSGKKRINVAEIVRSPVTIFNKGTSALRRRKGSNAFGNPVCR